MNSYFQKEVCKGLFFFILLITLFSCTQRENIDFSFILNKANNNRSEIKKIIDYYYISDSLKREAIYFLLQNMDSKYTHDILVKNSKLKTVSNGLYHKSITQKNINNYLDSLQLHYTDTIYNDIESIKATYFIKNIESSFSIWKTKSWSKNYSFNVFKEFILPYRFDTEKLSGWKEYFQKRYLPMIDTLSNKSVQNIFKLVKKDINSWYAFSYDAITPKTTQSLEDILEYQMGSCSDVAKLYVFALRSVGIAATVDYIPLWGKTNLGHSELVFWDEKNNPVLLQTGDWLNSPPPKVYRFYYSNRNTLFKRINEYKIPSFLYEKGYADVTNEYVKTSDVQIPKYNNKSETYFLSVFNSGKWKSIAFTFKKNKGNIIFKNIGRDIVYLPLLDLVPVGNPIIVYKGGDIEHLKIKKDKLIDIVIKCEHNYIEYWNNKWIKVRGVKLGNKKVKFSNIPSNTLYKIDGFLNDRIFTYLNKKVTVW